MKIIVPLACLILTGIGWIVKQCVDYYERRPVLRVVDIRHRAIERDPAYETCPPLRDDSSPKGGGLCWTAELVNEGGESAWEPHVFARYLKTKPGIVPDEQDWASGGSSRGIGEVLDAKGKASIDVGQDDFFPVLMDTYGNAMPRDFSYFVLSEVSWRDQLGMRHSARACWELESKLRWIERNKTTCR
jgi:hypothetical protein